MQSVTSSEKLDLVVSLISLNCGGIRVIDLLNGSRALSLLGSVILPPRCALSLPSPVELRFECSNESELEQKRVLVMSASLLRIRGSLLIDCEQNAKQVSIETLELHDNRGIVSAADRNLLDDIVRINNHVYKYYLECDAFSRLVSFQDFDVKIELRPTSHSIIELANVTDRHVRDMEAIEDALKIRINNEINEGLICRLKSLVEDPDALDADCFRLESILIASDVTNLQYIHISYFYYSQFDGFQDMAFVFEGADGFPLDTYEFDIR